MKKHSQDECTKSRRALMDTLEVLSGKWKFPILITLTFKSYRFKELAREVGISPRMLSKELKDLEMNRLVSRTVYDTTPVTIEYAATPYAKTLNKVLNEMRDWGMKHRSLIMAPEPKKEKAK
jgi:DNA-binding HxlR family transcriptional regulator